MPWKPVCCWVAAGLILGWGAGCRSSRVRGRMAIPGVSHWQATASESAEEAGPERALDGRLDTGWRSGVSEPQWLAIDMGRPAMVSGISLQWGEPFATDYSVWTSLDGVHWALGHEQTGGIGGWEQALFEPIVARHIRLMIQRGLQGNGAALRALEIWGGRERPHITVDGEPLPDALALLDGHADTTWRSPQDAAVLEMDLRRLRTIGSVRLDWGEAGFASNVVVAVSTNQADWSEAGRMQPRTGDFDVWLADQIHTARFVRLSFSGASSEKGFEVSRLALRGPEGAARPWGLYELAAARAPEGVYPPVFRNRQTYWAVAAGRQPGDAESLLDEWGVFAPRITGPTLAPLVAVNGEVWSAAQAETRDYRLADHGAPQPETVWRLPSGLKLTIRAMSRSGASPPMAWALYELRNESTHSQTGRLAWVVRPVRLPPPWAGGGLAPIYRIRRNVSAGGWQELLLNGHRLFAVPEPSLEFAAASFREGDITEFLLRGETPSTRTARDEDGLASAMWWTDFQLGPGERTRMIVAAPSIDPVAVARRLDLPDAAQGVGELVRLFETEWADGQWSWRAETGRFAPRIARAEAMEALHAQVGWLLGLRGLAVGGRGERLESMALRVAALVRVGQVEEARRWIDQVEAGVATDGWVPPRWMPGGRPVARIGQEGDHAAQGQFVFMVMEAQRFAPDMTLLQARYPAMRSAMAYLLRLRAEAEKNDARLPTEDRELLEGLLPSSSARTDRPRPARVYADHYWALLGWKEIRAAASRLGIEPDVTWADNEYRRLKAAVTRSLRTQMDRRPTSWLPAIAEEDVFDAVSVAWLFWPCDETDLAEPHEVQTSLDYFYEDFLRRRESGPTGPVPSDESLLLIPLASMGRGDYAREVLYDLLERRQPRGWQVWPDVVPADVRRPRQVGFMPDVRAAAAYVIGVRGLAARETGRRLDLFSGAPAEWLQHGTGFEVHAMPTAFGPLDLSGHWAGDRFRITIGGAARPPEGYRIWWPRQVRPIRVQANGRAVETFDERGVTLPYDFTGQVEAVLPYSAPWPRDSRALKDATRRSPLPRFKNNRAP